MSDEDEGVVAVGESEGEDANDVAHGDAHELPLAHASQFLAEPAYQVEQVGGQEPQSDVVYPLQIHQLRQLYLQPCLLALLGWLRKA